MLRITPKCGLKYGEEILLEADGLLIGFDADSAVAHSYMKPSLHDHACRRGAVEIISNFGATMYSRAF